MIVAPGCAVCNKGFSLDEEYFRIFLAGLALEHSQHAIDLFFTKVKRSIRRRPQIGFKVTSRMELVDFFTKSGIYLGKKTKIQVPDEDWERYSNVLDKYIKGLFYNEFRTILPYEYRIKHFIGNENYLSEFKLINKWNFDNKEIFFYGYSYIVNTYTSIWITIFYDLPFFVSFVGTEQGLIKLKA